jgi:catechol 2,3-dioxygenase-like lactoylglutathione lyase family enzyme
MLHVADVERSVAFYEHLGFKVGNRLPPAGPMGWCWLYQPEAPDWKRGANLMLARTDEPIDPKTQQALFYLYAFDLVSLHKALVAVGFHPRNICYPPYLPKGEFAVKDPDGYLLMVAQSDDDTP